MQRKPVTPCIAVLAVLILGLAGCASAPPEWPSVSECAPIDMYCIMRHKNDYMRAPWQGVTIKQTFDCPNVNNKVRLDWGTVLLPAPVGYAPGRSVRVTGINWSGRRPTASELQVINAALAPFERPRSASVDCGRFGNLLILEMWETRNGIQRIGVEMDKAGFRVVEAPSGQELPLPDRPLRPSPSGPRTDPVP